VALSKPGLFLILFYFYNKNLFNTFSAYWNNDKWKDLAPQKPTVKNGKSYRQII
jgi:hypothetical protein